MLASPPSTEWSHNFCAASLIRVFFSRKCVLGEQTHRPGHAVSHGLAYRTLSEERKQSTALTTSVNLYGSFTIADSAFWATVPIHFVIFSVVLLVLPNLAQLIRSMPFLCFSPPTLRGYGRKVKMKKLSVPPPICMIIISAMAGCCPCGCIRPTCPVCTSPRWL